MALGIVLLLFVVPHAILGDGTERFNAIQTLLAGRPMRANPYPLVGSLFSVPLYLLGHVVKSPEWWVSRYNVLVFAVGVLCLFLLMRRRIAPALLRSFLLLLGASCMLPHELGSYGAETFNAMAVGVGLVAWEAGHWKLATLILALGVANMPGSLGGLALALGWWAWREKRLRAVLPVLLAAVIFGAENWLRRGSPFVTGYEHLVPPRTLLPYSGMNGFTYPLFFGVLSLLLSFGKGLLFFAPGIFLPFRAGYAALGWARQVAVLWLLYVAGLLLVYGHWWAWFGGHAWGPRFLIFASLPSCLLLAGQLRKPPASELGQLAVLAALALSIWVGVNGVTFNMYGQGICIAANYVYASFCWYLPEFSVLWQPFVEPPRSIPLKYWLLFTYALVVFAWLATPIFIRFGQALTRVCLQTWAVYRGRPAWRL
jgi:hypothetical protein